MDTNMEQQVRQKAYELWLRDGMAHGRDSDYWYAAERELSALRAPPVAAGRPAAKTKRKARTAKTKM